MRAEASRPTGRDRWRRFAAAVCCALLLQPVLWAMLRPAPVGNDTFVNESAGNLHFLKNYSVAIRSERLVVGPPARADEDGLWRVPFHVEYDLENLTAKIVHATVGFPLPACDLVSFVSATHLAFNTYDESTCVKRPSMKLAVDGRAVDDGRWELVFTLDDKPLADSPTATAIAVGARAVIAAVRDPEVSFFVNDSEYLARSAELCRLLGGTITGSDCPAFRRISVYNTFIWNHAFPAKRHTRVVHDYLVQASRNIPAARDFSHDEFCLEDKSISGAYARYREQPDDDRGFYREFYTEYVLRTGAMWAAPIGDFELVIRKARPTQFVSTCFQGLQRESPVEFRARRRNFTPTEDLRVLFFETGEGKN